VDLHDAALNWAQTRAPGITWNAARPALRSSRWLDIKDSLAAEAVPRAIYALVLLASTDSAALASVVSDMNKADTASTAAVRLFLQGYRESQRWYAEALEFFLTQPWVPDGPQGESLAGYVDREWRLLAPDRADQPQQVPDIRPRLFGYPQAVPHYGVPAPLFDRLLFPQNETARLWLKRHGQAALLRTLRWLPPGDTSLVLLQAGAETMRVTTIPRQSRESLNGFLEASDAIAIDPGYSPLLALGAVLHEWQHLVFRRKQLEAFTTSLRAGPLPLIEIPGVEPFLAEGFAEWSAERILEPLQTRWPLLALGELQKRAGLVNNSGDDQHTIGYALVATLAATLRDPSATAQLLLRYAESPSQLARVPALRKAWRKYDREPDRILAVPPRRILIPEVTFTVEDGFPDVLGSRILVPGVRRAVQ
jgi:hypothetical protein